MNDATVISLVLLITAGTAFWLETQGKLLSVLSAVSSPSASGVETGSKWLIAIAGLVLILSILPDNDRAVFLTVIVIAALAANYQSKGSSSLISMGLSGGNLP